MCRTNSVEVQVGGDVSTIELNGIVGALAHLACHLSAIRQIHRGAKVPAEST
jgi:hypothetical protein